MDTIKIEKRSPKVEVQGMPGVYGNAQQPRVVPTSNQGNQNGLDEFLNFDNVKANGLKQERIEEMETEEMGHVETVETTEEENVDVVFEVNGQKINACMSVSMAQMLKDSEEMRLQVIDRIMAEAGNNPDQPITLTTADPTSRDTSATESADSPNVNAEPGKPRISTQSPRLNGQTLGKRPLPGVMSPERKNVITHKVVTRSTLGTSKPKFLPGQSLRPAIPQKKVSSPFLGISPPQWDHKAIVALIECFKAVNDRLNAIGATKNIDLWSIIGKRMRSKGFSFSDSDCQIKFSVLTNAFRMKKKETIPGKNTPWEYYKSMENALMEEIPTSRVKPTKPAVTAKPRTIPVITVEDDSPIASDDEYDDFEDPGDPLEKKARTVASIDKFRRTYLRVETEKLKEMKAARALQQEQLKLQKERNQILSTIAELLSLKK